MIYYFLFSDGSYSDYAVGGLYTCDHEVTEGDWDKFLQIRVNARRDMLEYFKELACERVGIKYGELVNIFSAPEYKQYIQWVKSQESDDVSFQKMHNMIEVNYVECHGGN